MAWRGSNEDWFLSEISCISAFWCIKFGLHEIWADVWFIETLKFSLKWDSFELKFDFVAIEASEIKKSL